MRLEKKYCPEFSEEELRKGVTYTEVNEYFNSNGESIGWYAVKVKKKLLSSFD